LVRVVAAATERVSEYKQSTPETITAKTDDRAPQLPGWIVDHMRKYVETNGTEGHVWNGVPTLLPTTAVVEADGKHPARVRRIPGSNEPRDSIGDSGARITGPLRARIDHRCASSTQSGCGSHGDGVAGRVSNGSSSGNSAPSTRTGKLLVN
jgi:hypothetical protein